MEGGYADSCKSKRAMLWVEERWITMLLVEREVGEGCAAGRERRYWVGESEGGYAEWYDRCATGRERRCWAALLDGKEETTVDC